jgi:hypothetical protein
MTLEFRFPFSLKIHVGDFAFLDVSSGLLALQQTVSGSAYRDQYAIMQNSLFFILSKYQFSINVI